MMRYFANILFIITLLLALPEDSAARIFAPSNNSDIIGTHPEPWVDENGNGTHEASETNYVDINHNGKWDGDVVPDVTNMTYSATVDGGVRPTRGSLGNWEWWANLPSVVCFYDRRPDLNDDKLLNGSAPAKLVVNEFFVKDSAKVLFGIDDPAACPLPGSRVFIDYPNAIAGEFLISGVICVVNTVIFDSMFRIYCTIILWFYNILYAMIIIYVMFYGLSIMLGIGNDPIREAPKRIIKVVLIFFLAANAQFGFRIIHNGFLSVLSGFTEMLTEIQPYHTERGHPAYQKTFLSGLGAALTLNMLDGPGKLLDENGNVWKPVKSGQNFYSADANDATARAMPASPSMKEYTAPENYVPFRVPAQQWSYELSTEQVQEYDAAGNAKMDSSGKPVMRAVKTYRMYPVFQELMNAKSVPSDQTACIFDVKWNPKTKRLEEYPHCQKNFWPTLPKVMPYGEAYLYKIANIDAGPAGSIKGSGTGDLSLAPTRLLDTKENKTKTCETVGLDGSAVSVPFMCRKPFQGVLGKIDAIFNATVGDDSAKGLGGLVIAILLWGAGAGIPLSLLLMTGIVTMFIAFFQVVWTYVTALMAITFLLMLSPIFVSCALFNITEKFFKGWLSALISYTMQPFLVLSFLFVLSNMTSLDRLEKMARKEVDKKQLTSQVGGSGNLVRTMAPSFLGPLYEKPADFDEVYYSDRSQTSKDKTLINADQREKYLQRKSEYILNYWMSVKAGTFLEKSYIKSEANSIGNFGDKKDLMQLWDEGKYYIKKGKGDAELQNTGKKGISAVQQFRNDTNDTSYDDLLNCYKQGCSVNIITKPPKFESPCRSGNTVCYPGINSDPNKLGYEPSLTKNPVAAGDDGDSFVGEPPSKDKDGNDQGAEYPPCIKFCPEFNPPYDPSDKRYSSPKMNVPVSTTKINGTPCPNGPDGKPGICAPNAECTGNCMEIKGARSFNYSALTTAILTWILLNVISAAFIAKVPAIAEALSQWTSYAPKGMPLGGASRAWDDAGMDAWTQQERSGFFHVGGMFDPGVTSGRPGGMFALGGALTRLIPVKYVAADGSIQTRQRQRGKGVMANKNDALDEKKAKIVERLKQELQIAKEVKMKSVDTPVSISTLNIFGALRPDYKTGLTHNELWDIIQKVLSEPGSMDAINNADYGRIKTLVNQRVGTALDTKPQNREGVKH